MGQGAMPMRAAVACSSVKPPTQTEKTECCNQTFISIKSNEGVEIKSYINVLK